MIEIEKYETFFADYQGFEAKHWSDRFEAEKKEVLNLAVGFRNLEQRLNKIVLEESPQYNIFSILNVRHYETKLHTPFLVNLLNPKGSHGQGALFLDLFFEMVLKLDYRFSTIQNYKIVEELSTEDKGRIDIIMTFYDGHNRVGIVIENKTRKGNNNDEPLQLQRYYDYLTKELGLGQNYRKLYYLTPEKRKPSKISIKEKVATQLRESGELTEIGYNKDIADWLKNSLSQIKSKRIQFIIQNYIEVALEL